MLLTMPLLIMLAQLTTLPKCFGRSERAFFAAGAMQGRKCENCESLNDESMKLRLSSQT